MKIYTATDGEWIKVPGSNHQQIACCDCGLVHTFEFKIMNGEILWRATRHRIATEHLRKIDLDQTVLI